MPSGSQLSSSTVHPREEADQGLPITTVARVMSPNPDDLGLLLGVHGAICQVCQDPTDDPALCAQCGAYGHATCMGLEKFNDYFFCRQCFPQVIGQFAQLHEAQRREEWRRSLSAQTLAWRSRATEALGLGASMGVALGGAAAAAAGAAVAVIQGIGQGARQSAGAAALGNVPPPPPEAEPRVQPVPKRLSGLRRCRSVENLGGVDKVHCLACWSPSLGSVREVVHQFRGDCKLSNTVLHPLSATPGREGVVASATSGRGCDTRVEGTAE